MEAETKQLWTQTIGKLLLKQSAPAVIGMLVLALYNFVDSIFIGKYVGMEGLAATSIVFPIQMIIGAFAMAFGVGAASIISRSIGAKSYEKVWQVFGTLQLMTFGFLVILSVVWLCFVPQLLDLFGATPESMEFASAYMVPLLFGAVFLGFEMSNNNIIRSVGHATMSMKIMLTSAITNLILDFVFMKIFGWGMAGAAWATVISWIVSCGMMLWYYLSPKNVIPIAIKHFRIHLQSAKEIILIGLPSFFRQIVASLTAALINNYLRKYGGTEAIAIYGIVYKVLQLYMMPMFGIVQGMQPIIGYNYGAKSLDRVKKVVLLGIQILTLFTTAISLIYRVFPTFLVSFFSEDPQLIANTGKVLQMVVACFAVVGFQVVSSSMYQALGFVKKAFLLTLLRQLIVFIPVLFLMLWLREDKLQAVWLSFPITDAIGVVFTVLIFVPDFKKMKSA